jgi:hypothetical protein
MFTPQFVLIWTVLPVILGAVTGHRKGRMIAGIVWPLVLGWIGFIIIACERPTTETRIRRRAQELEIEQAAARRYASRMSS